MLREDDKTTRNTLKYDNKQQFDVGKISHYDHSTMESKDSSLDYDVVTSVIAI